MQKQFIDADGHHSDLLWCLQRKCHWPSSFFNFISCIDKSVSICLFAYDCLLFEAINSTSDQVVLNESLDAISLFNWSDLRKGSLIKKNLCSCVSLTKSFLMSMTTLLVTTSLPKLTVLIILELCLLTIYLGSHTLNEFVCLHVAS